MKIHYNNFKLPCKTLRVARRRMLNGGEPYKFHLLIDAELELDEYSAYMGKSESKYKVYNYSLLRHIELGKNYLIEAYDDGEDNIYMYSMFRARKTYERKSNKMSSKSEIDYRKFNNLFRPRNIYFNSKRLDMK